jgi:hypothetical protein
MRVAFRCNRGDIRAKHGNSRAGTHGCEQNEQSSGPDTHRQVAKRPRMTSVGAAAGAFVKACAVMTHLEILGECGMSILRPY